jgi:hypothetical protein
MAGISHAASAGAAMPQDHLQAQSPAQDSLSSKPVASWRSAVSKPSVNPAVDLSQKLSGFDALVLALAQPPRLHSAMTAEFPVSGAIACRLA